MGRIIALDVGDARIGIAVTDPLGLIPQPFLTLDRADKYMEKLIDQLRSLEVEKVVIGLPLELTGNIGPQAQKVKNFARRLDQKLEDALGRKIELTLVDERFSTAAAERIVQGSGLKNKQRSKVVDRISAAVILETYLMTRGQDKGYKA